MVEGRRSDPFLIRAGVLQGSVISPFLYSIFIDDLARCLNNLPGVKIGACKLNCTMYADDIAVFGRTAEELNLLLRACATDASFNRYRFSVGKCAVIGDDVASYLLDGEIIPQVRQFTYLGAEMGRSGLLAKEFVERRAKMCIEAGMKLLSLGMNLGGLSPRTNRRLYKVFVRSKLEAGLPLVLPRVAISRRLDAAQRTVVARMFHCSPNSSGPILLAICNLPRITFRHKLLRSRFVHRVAQLSDTHILKLMSLGRGSFLERLGIDVFTVEEAHLASRKRITAAEFGSLRTLAMVATDGFLKAPLKTGKLLPFVNPGFDPLLCKQAIMWLLKKYLAHEARHCANCSADRCTQQHLAYCTNLLRSQVAIGAAVSACLPYLLVRSH